MQRYAEPCTPPRWARGGHAQTLFGHLLPSAAAPVTASADFARDELELPDGDRLVLYKHAGTSGVRVHLFHGLSGDVDSDYMRRAAARFVSDGHDVWTVNHRGAGTGFGFARRPYHAGRTEDLAAVFAASRAQAPTRVQLAVGFSLSGNALLLHAAQGRTPPLDGLIAVNPPIDLARSTADIGKGLNRIYQLRFLWRLGRAVRARRRLGFARSNAAIPPWISFLEFDDRFTAPECGFADGHDYYARCSTHERLAAVETPSVILTAADDPFVAPDVFDAALRNPAILLHVEPSGGHVGYVARNVPKSGRWLDDALASYVSQLAAAEQAAAPDRALDG